MRKIISFLLLSFVVYALQAQIKDPVKFKTELTTLSPIRRQKWCLQLPLIKVGMFILPTWEMAVLFLQHLMLIINQVSNLSVN